VLCRGDAGRGGLLVTGGEPSLVAVADGWLAHDPFECGAEGGLCGVADGGADAGSAAACGAQVVRGEVHPPGDQVLEGRQAGVEVTLAVRCADATSANYCDFAWPRSDGQKARCLRRVSGSG
jgi:hypothetical protein